VEKRTTYFINKVKYIKNAKKELQN